MFVLWFYTDVYVVFDPVPQDKEDDQGRVPDSCTKHIHFYNIKDILRSPKKDERIPQCRYKVDYTLFYHNNYFPFTYNNSPFKRSRPSRKSRTLQRVFGDRRGRFKGELLYFYIFLGSGNKPIYMS